MLSTEFLIALISGGVVGAIVSGVTQIIIASKKEKSDAPVRLTDSAMKIVTDLQEEVGRLQKKVIQLEYRIAVGEVDYAIAMQELALLDEKKARQLRSEALARYIESTGGSKDGT